MLIYIQLDAALSGPFIQPVFEGEHDIAAHGVGAGFAKVVQLTDALHILVLVEQVKA